jgi:hypothetical protein
MEHLPEDGVGYTTEPHCRQTEHEGVDAHNLPDEAAIVTLCQQQMAR